MNYRICPNCGAALDPGERCDCKEEKNAAPMRQHQNGKVETVLASHISTPILQNKLEGCQV